MLSKYTCTRDNIVIERLSFHYSKIIEFTGNIGNIADITFKVKYVVFKGKGTELTQ